MANKNTTCCICGTEYEVCHFCPDVANFIPWRRVCDTSDHYKIYLILSEYDGGILNKSDALEKLKAIGVKLEDCKKFRPHIYKTIKDILGEEKKEPPKYHTKKSYKTVNGTEDMQSSTENESSVDSGDN